MTDADGADAQPTRDRVGIIGGITELAAHAFGAIARIFTH